MGSVLTVFFLFFFNRKLLKTGPKSFLLESNMGSCVLDILRGKKVISKFIIYFRPSQPICDCRLGQMC